MPSYFAADSKSPWRRASLTPNAHYQLDEVLPSKEDHVNRKKEQNALT